MSTEASAGVLLIALPIAFNLIFGLLGARFEYPSILRRPTSEILERFREGGRGLILLWWSFAMTAVLLAPAAVLLAIAIGDADEALITLSAFLGVLAALVQALGLVRWPFVVPYLARLDADPETRATAEVIFQALHRYLGVGVGEHLGYLLTGAWSLVTGVALTQTVEVPSWLGVVGIVVGPLLMLCSLEFVGRDHDEGWKLAERLTPITYILWSLWLMATGIALLA